MSKAIGVITVYNIHQTDYTNEPNNYYCGRSRSGNPLSNPFSHKTNKPSLAKLTFSTREEAINAFEKYFDKAYGVDEELTKAFDEIYEHYKNGEDIYLGCFCKPLSCHADIIADRLQRKLIKEKMEERKKMLKKT